MALNKAFTLIEVLISLTLFSVVMLVGMGALLSIIDANAKMQAVQSVMNNLNITIDSMMRAVRMGRNYYCGNDIPSWPVSPRDCSSSPSSGMSFVSHEGNLVSFYLNGTQIYRRKCESSNLSCSDLPMTAPDIEITRFDVYITGAEGRYTKDRDTLQPTAVFIIEGVAGSEQISGALYGKKRKIRTDFKLQTVATQRLLDI